MCFAQVHPDKIAKELCDNKKVWERENDPQPGGGNPLSPGAVAPCNFYFANGWCRNGTNCKFRHTGKGPKKMRGRAGGKGMPFASYTPWQGYGTPPQSPAHGQVMNGQPVLHHPWPPQPPPFPPPLPQGKGKGRP